MRIEEESKVSQRGSVVIPKIIRKILQIDEGDTALWIAETETGVVEVKKREKK